MNKVKVLVEGYADLDVGDVFTDYASVILVTTEKNEKIIFDPGCNRKLLLESLEEERLKVKDIDYVYISHKHIDHMMLMGIFPNAKVCTANSIYEYEKFRRHTGDVWDDSIKIVKTPGHIEDHSSLIVQTTDGDYLLAGDLLWWGSTEEQKVDDYEELINHFDFVAKDKESLVRSRKRVLKMCDFVIPGHGKMFKNEFRNRV
jgi:glyoxylase-like metal-dependent hydrolase (beta-lactamase superfamily II)